MTKHNVKSESGYRAILLPYHGYLSIQKRIKNAETRAVIRIIQRWWNKELILKIKEDTETTLILDNLISKLEKRIIQDDNTI